MRVSGKLYHEVSRTLGGDVETDMVQAWWGTWWPWAEANQGLLSSLALFAAVLVAVIEARRARLAMHARLRDFSKATIEVIEALIKESRAVPPAGENPGWVRSDWDACREAVVVSLQAMLAAAPDGQMAIETARVVRRLGPGYDPLIGDRAEVPRLITYLEARRDALRGLVPKVPLL